MSVSGCILLVRDNVFTQTRAMELYRSAGSFWSDIIQFQDKNHDSKIDSLTRNEAFTKKWHITNELME